MQSCKSNEYQRQPLLALYDKISRLKSMDRILINTTSNFKAKSSQKSPDIRAILDHSRLSLERSRSSKTIEQLLNHKKRDPKNELGIESQLMQLYLNQMSNQFIKESKDNRTDKCLQLLEPTFVQQKKLDYQENYIFL